MSIALLDIRVCNAWSLCSQTLHLKVCLLTFLNSILQTLRTRGYIKHACPGAGGIQRYLEAFPDGGFFVGKNFVFDERVTVGLEGGKTLGSCLTCSAPHDSYEPRRRCQHCRMLVLICPTCAAKVQVCLFFGGPACGSTSHQVSRPLESLCHGIDMAVTCSGVIVSVMHTLSCLRPKGTGIWNTCD